MIGAGQCGTVGGSGESAAAALVEMRRLLGVLRQGDETASLAPAPGLADLPTLVRHLSEVGLTVDLRADDPPPGDVPDGVDLSA